MSDNSVVMHFVCDKATSLEALGPEMYGTKVQDDRQGWDW